MDKNQIFTLWIGKPNKLLDLCVHSWVALKYKVNLYCDFDNREALKEAFADCMDSVFFHHHSIVPLETDVKSVQAQSDIWRFCFLYKFGGTWLDGDMFLFKRLPEDDIIISSEHTPQKGAYKTKGRTMVPNIGVLRLPKDSELMRITLDQKISWTSKSRVNKFMLKYQKLLRKNEDYMKFVAEPNVYCPVSWANSKQLYYLDEIPSGKYGIDQMSINDIINNSIGVHLWNNFTYNKHKIDFNKVHQLSLFSKLLKYKPAELANSDDHLQ
tara:strand:- start:4932 stop:5738 length:807 start_codon:yes stop_codon:yes gene_type:complete